MTRTSIEWTDFTWNPVTGCSKVSAGCAHCYAERVMKRFEKERKFTDVQLHEDRLEQPLHWKKPRNVFVNSMSDLFHEAIPDEFIDKMFAVMALAHWHTYQILTKRSKRMKDYINHKNRCLSDFYGSMNVAARKILGVDGIAIHPTQAHGMVPDNWPLPNVWLGVSVESNDHLCRVEDLLQTPAAVRFLSVEPMLGQIDARPYLDPFHDHNPNFEPVNKIDWVICGGESGPGARPMHPDWARSLREQCQAANVSFFFKQWGEWLPGQNEPYPYQPYKGQLIAHDQDGEWDKPNKKLNKNNYVMWEPNGAMHPGGSRGYENYFDVKAWAERVGKKRAGRLLDGREWNERPDITP